jgi:hypothetical protein
VSRSGFYCFSKEQNARIYFSVRTMVSTFNSFFLSLSNSFIYKIVLQPPEIPMPCNPNPCAVNAVCKERNGVGSCSCMKNYFGDPYVHCRPQCVVNDDCDSSQACMNMRCIDACNGACGLNSRCSVINHSPTCQCLEGFTGNPLSSCHRKPDCKKFILPSLFVPFSKFFHPNPIS